MFTFSHPVIAIVNKYTSKYISQYKRNIIKDKHTDTWLNVDIGKLTYQPTKTYITVSNMVYILIT